MANYHQGILIVEGSYACIFANKIDGNNKANIACGGLFSDKTRIKHNQITNGKSEGVFVVEGQDKLHIEDNDIELNVDGIVLINSLGYVKKNRIRENQNNGILTLHRTVTIIEENIISRNELHGVHIKCT
jgi:hypothetical protein